jgi:2-polyprenyl-6-methoxyphenol hydroxylase-like FAD-dependent oxidoreductase
MGMLNMPVISRQTSAPGLALIGDAALAGDPVWGNGLGWAFQSASWLVEETALALASSSPRALDAALVTYSQVHRERRHGRFVHHVDCASIRPFNWLEKLFIAAVAKNPRLAAYTGPDALRHLQSSPPFNAHFEALTGASAPFQNARNLFRRLRFPARSTAHHLGQT